MAYVAEYVEKQLVRDITVEAHNRRYPSTSKAQAD